MALPWSLAAPPTTVYLRGNLEFAIPELRAKADLCIKARALDAPTLRTRAPRHSPTITRRPNPCAVAVAGSKHHISIFPGGATCTRPKPTHPPVAMRLGCGKKGFHIVSAVRMLSKASRKLQSEF